MKPTAFVELVAEPAELPMPTPAFEIFEQLPVMKRFAGRYSVRRFNGVR
jgi:hypothetical protein